MQKISTCLWFDGRAAEAAGFYTTTFSNSKLGASMPGPDGQPLSVEFELEGRQFLALNGRPDFTFNESVSLVVNCQTQDEVDRYWEALVDGGEEGRCGWLKDRFGLSWQVIPLGFTELLAGPDADGSRRAMEAMMGMRKLDISALRKAYDGD